MEGEVVADPTASKVRTPLTLLERRDFEALISKTYKKVFNFAFRLSGSRSDAEEITQDSFIRAYRAFGDYRADRPFDNWVMKIASRVFLDLLRARGRRIATVSLDAPIAAEGADDMHLEMPDQDPSPEQKLIGGLLGEDMHRAISKLSDDQRHLVEMADLQELPYRVIAETLGKPVGTVRSRLHRTHRLLRSNFGDRDQLTAMHKDDSGIGNRVLSGH